MSTAESRDSNRFQLGRNANPQRVRYKTAIFNEFLDNYGTHKTAMIRNWLAKRARFHVHSTLTYGSWINLVECWFAELTNKRIRRGVFRSVKELEAAIRE